MRHGVNGVTVAMVSEVLRLTTQERRRLTEDLHGLRTAPAWGGAHSQRRDGEHQGCCRSLSVSSPRQPPPGLSQPTRKQTCSRPAQSPLCRCGMPGRHPARSATACRSDSRRCPQPLGAVDAKGPSAPSGATPASCSIARGTSRTISHARRSERSTTSVTTGRGAGDSALRDPGLAAADRAVVVMEDSSVIPG